MKVHILTPYDIGKDLGFAYNQACAMVPDGDWVCLMDYDCMLLTPDAGYILHGYAERGEQALYTCYTNRCHPTSPQCVTGMSDVSDIKEHIIFADKQKQYKKLMRIRGNVSGFLMLFPKSLWLKYPFKEGIGCLGVDTDYWQRLAKNNIPMYIMQNLYVLHLYRMITNNKDHLL